MALQEISEHTIFNMAMKYAHLAQRHKKEAVNPLKGLTASKIDGHKMVTIIQKKISNRVSS